MAINPTGTGIVSPQSYQQQLYGDIAGPTANDPARRAYLLNQAGLAGFGGQAAGSQGYMVGSPWQNPNAPKPAPAGGVPTFAPPDTTLSPSAAIGSQSDPKIAALLAQLTQQAGSAGGPTNGADIEALKKQIQDAQGGIDAASAKFSASSGQTGAQSAQLQALLAQLMKGQGIDVGPMNNDPQAQAFRVAKLREAERGRESEAARLGASGLSGSGDFDARTAQINEAAGTDIAGFEADLTGKRRQEATQTAVTGAGLQLSDLERQQQAAQAEASTSASTGALKLNSLQSLLQTLMGQDAQTASLQNASQQSLLAQLLGEQGRVQGSQLGQASTAQQAAVQGEQLRMEQERMRQQTEDRARQLAAQSSGGVGGHRRY